MTVQHDEPATRKDLDEMKQALTDKIDANSVKIDWLIRRTLKNGERLDKMLTEEKFKVYFSELMNNIDGLAKGVSRGETGESSDELPDGSGRE